MRRLRSRALLVVRKLLAILALIVLVATAAVSRSFATPGRSAAQPAPQRTGAQPDLSASGLSLISEPRAGIAPFLDLIGSARRTIELTMYELEDRSVEVALARAAHRGVDVRVLLNGGYYSEPETTNDPADAYLASHGVHVRYTPSSFALTHQKTLTVDGILSAVMTLNLDGRYASTRDYAILDARPEDVQAIIAAFTADWTDRKLIASRGSGDLVWSPGAQTTVLGLIESAHHSIDLENEEMADPPATDALCAAARRGVDVKVVMTYDSDWRDPFDQLSTCGVHIRLYHGQSYDIHAKLLEVDGARALVSSQNLSRTSLEDNRELGILVTAPRLIAALSRDFGADDAGAEPY